MEGIFSSKKEHSRIIYSFKNRKKDLKLIAEVIHVSL